MGRRADHGSPPQQRTLHVQHSVEAVKGWHAEGVGAMKRGEASEAANLFLSDRFRQSRDDRRDHFCVLRISQNRDSQIL
jgi:hypothetical protein